MKPQNSKIQSNSGTCLREWWQSEDLRMSSGFLGGIGKEENIGQGDVLRDVHTSAVGRRKGETRTQCG